MSDVKNISERISYKKHPDFITLVISPRLEEKKQLLLSFWFFAWTFCGLVFISQLFFAKTQEFIISLIVMISFWAYYEYRIGYVWMWRRKGVELIKLEDGKMTYKRSLRSMGKAYDFYVDNIRNFGFVEIKPTSFGAVMSNSFWVIGGERLRFEYQNKEVKIGIQLSDEEADKLRRFLNDLFIDELKKLKEQGRPLASV